MTKIEIQIKTDKKTNALKVQVVHENIDASLVEASLGDILARALTLAMEIVNEEGTQPSLKFDILNDMN